MKHDLVNENIKVGYGQANSKKEAKQIAINEIASSLSISVQSSISTTKYKDKDSYRKKIINNSQQNINATLNGIKTKID
ncbi:MAG: hypothetical protein U9Q83_11730 [Bacteroidota bacterium]|nr:hypothetical protein [Bacteroidota bacterium]